MQQQRRADDPNVEQADRERRIGKPAARVANGRADSRQTHEQERRNNQLNVGERRLANGGIRPNTKNGCQRSLEREKSRDERDQDEGSAAQQRPDDSPQLGAVLGVGVVAQHRHQRRANRAADDEIVKHRRNRARGDEGGGDTPLAKERGHHKVAPQPEKATAQVAQEQEPCRGDNGSTVEPGRLHGPDSRGRGCRSAR